MSSADRRSARSAVARTPDFRGEFRRPGLAVRSSSVDFDPVGRTWRFSPAMPSRRTGNLDWINRLYCNDFALFRCTAEFDPCSGLPTDDFHHQRDSANGFAFSQEKSACPDSDDWRRAAFIRTRKSGGRPRGRRGMSGYTPLVQRVAKDDSLCSMENLT
jgi:hypothetical protein